MKWSEWGLRKFVIFSPILSYPKVVSRFGVESQQAQVKQNVDFLALSKNINSNDSLLCKRFSESSYLNQVDNSKSLRQMAGLQL